MCVRLLLCTAGLLLADEVNEKEFKALRGVWTVVEAEHNGQPLDRIVGGKLTIQEVNFLIVAKNGVELKGDLWLDPARKPKHMDLTHQAGPLRDKTWEAIYDLKDDELRICYAEADSGKARPAEFKTEPQSGLLLVKLKRK